MSKKLDALRAQRDKVANAQGDVQAELMANSIDPQRAAVLMHHLMITAVSQYELTQDMAAVVERERRPLMERLFKP